MDASTRAAECAHAGHMCNSADGICTDAGGIYADVCARCNGAGVTCKSAGRICVEAHIWLAQVSDVQPQGRGSSSTETGLMHLPK